MKTMVYKFRCKLIIFMPSVNRFPYMASNNGGECSTYIINAKPKVHCTHHDQGLTLCVPHAQRLGVVITCIVFVF